MEKLGDFQQGIGEASGEIGIITSYIFASIMFIFAIIVGIFAFTPSVEGSNDICSQDLDCNKNGETCQDGHCFGTKKKKRFWMLIISIVLILIGFSIIWYSKWYNRWVHKSRTNAQIGATFMEANAVFDMLKQKN